MSKPAKSQGSALARLLPGLLVTGVAIAALLYFIDLDQLRVAFTLGDYRWFPLVLLLFLGTLLTRSIAWRTILKEQLSLRDSFMILNQAYLLNNVLPFRLGEFGRALLASNKAGLGFWQALSTIVIERVFDLGIAAGLLLFTVPLVVGADWARSAASISLVLVVAGFAALFWMASRPKQVEALIIRLARPWPRLSAWLVDKSGSFLAGLSALKDGGRFARVLVWMLLTWAFNIAWYYVLMRAFLPAAEPLWALFSIGVASVGVALPSSPGYIGVFEGVLVGALSFFSVDPAVALAYAVVAHVTYLAVTALIGVIGFWQQGESLGGIYRKLLNRPSK